MKRVARLSAEQRRSMAQASRRTIEQRFSETNVISAYLDALGSVVPVER
jgi:hypothetical protein